MDRNRLLQKVLGNEKPLKITFTEETQLVQSQKAKIQAIIKKE